MSKTFWKAPLFKWLERLLWMGALVFVIYRLGPQIGALVGLESGRRPAPDLRFTALDGSAVDMSDLHGSVVVLNFWATWCGPCRLEMPSLQSLHEDRANDGVVVLGLSVDVQDEAGVEDFLRERGITYPVGIATHAHRQAYGGIALLPTTFLIDRKGVIRHQVAGYFASPALRVAVDRLVKEPG